MPGAFLAHESFLQFLVETEGDGGGANQVDVESITHIVTIHDDVVNQEFLKEKLLKVQTMARGFAWLDTGTHDSLSEASTFIEVLEKRQGFAR